MKTLTNHPILTSFYVYDSVKKAYYVTIKPSPQLWSLCLTDHGRVKTREEVQQLAIEYPFPEHACEPGPLFRCLLVELEETGACAIVFYGTVLRNPRFKGVNLLIHALSAPHGTRRVFPKTVLGRLGFVSKES